MMSVEDYESLLETLDTLSDSRLMGRIKKAESDIKRGKVKALEKIEKEMGIVESCLYKAGRKGLHLSLQGQQSGFSKGEDGYTFSR